MNRSLLIVFTALTLVCVASLMLPTVLVEPDDYDWYSGMISFSRGHFVSSEEEIGEIHEAMAERFRRGEFHFPLVRNEKGFVHERSPGYYGLLALFYLFELDRYTNVFLVVGCVLFFFFVLRKYAGERIALSACLLMIFNPTFLTGLYRVYMSDFAYFVFGLFGMGTYWMARERGNAWLHLLAGFLLSVSVVFRVTNAIFFVSIALYELCILVFPKALPQAVGGSPPRPVFAPRSLVPLALGLVIGIVPLLLYNYHTMGKILAAGYSYRFSHEGTEYFSLFGRNATFSLRNLGYTFPVGLPRLLLGYQIIVLAPAGFFFLGRERRRLALFAGLWLAAYWAFYLCYSTIREDSFQFMCRKFLPSLPALCIGAASVLEAIKGRWRIIILATFAVFGIAVASEFTVRFVVPQPFGKPVFPRRQPPPEAFREVADRLGQVDGLLEKNPNEALRPLRRCVIILKDLAQTMPGPVGAELGGSSASLHELEKELKQSLKEGKKPSREQIAQYRAVIRETHRKLEELAGAIPGPPRFGLPGPAGIPPDVRMRVELLHRSMDEAKMGGRDTTVAAFADDLARIEIENRRFHKAVEFLNTGIESLGEAPPPPPPVGSPRFPPVEARPQSFGPPGEQGRRLPDRRF